LSSVALGLLARDVGLARLTLRVERVELLLETFLAGLARVDGAAELSDERLFHCAATVFQAKEKERIPTRAGYVARDRGQRFERPTLILEIVVAHRHAVLDALVFADEAVPAIGRSLAGWRRRTGSPPSSSSRSAFSLP